MNNEIWKGGIINAKSKMKKKHLTKTVHCECSNALWTSSVNILLNKNYSCLWLWILEWIDGQISLMWIWMKHEIALPYILYMLNIFNDKLNLEWIGSNLNPNNATGKIIIIM